MSDIADRGARERFSHELDRNFSVIASAGSGKTTAITDRIVRIAQDRHALEWLPQLIVVTYTNRAADEMQQRTRLKILEAGLSLEVIEAFSRAFFGTIHSFCVKLLTAHGHHLGLPSNLELITDDEDLWNRFVQQQTTIGRSLTAENRRVLLRHVQARQLMELARKHDVDLSGAQPDTPCPDTTFGEVYASVADSRTAKTIPRAQAELKRWEKRWRETDEFVPWPPCASGAKDFLRRWREAFRPLREWVNACALCVAAEVQRDYRDFRLEGGAITYADQVALAGELIRLPAVGKRIRERNYRVILDEAQDTDPQQFFLLLEITRPSDAAGVWTQDRQPRKDRGPRSLSESPPRPGHFCMVGDFQQSIYRDPSDLARYRELHETLIETGAAEELKFSVTFRLDNAQLDFVNETFGEILNDRDGQVRFVELNPRPDALPGQVVRLELDGDVAEPAPGGQPLHQKSRGAHDHSAGRGWATQPIAPIGCPPGAKRVDLNLSETQRAVLEAQQLARWIRGGGLEKLRARSWREVAILSPRKAWLNPLREALFDVDLPVEVHSESDLEAENPAYAWVTALLAVMTDPHASFEIVGVLREVFGLSDDELAQFCKGDGERFQIAQKAAGRGSVPDSLNLLHRTREAIAQRPLFTAVREIVRATQVPERLRALPAEEFGDLIADLEGLLMAAAAAEARGSSLAEFAQNLRANYLATRETRPSSSDAIQLITAHKAKGSEWDAVIVPFLSRKVWFGATSYPRAIKTIEAECPQIIFDRTDYEEFEEEFKKAGRQEMERLLYVALTRARHTLVFALDRQFFPTARGEVQTDSQLKWLRGDERNESAIMALTTDSTSCAETMSRQRAAPAREFREDFGSLRLETGWIDTARQRAAAFVHTISPSKFAPEEKAVATTEADVWKEIEPELRPALISNPATRYGLWWHDFAQRIPWREDPNSWERIFESSRAASPDPARSLREWTLLRSHFTGSEDFRKPFAGSAAILHAELPLMLKIDATACLEGIVDLVVFDPDGKKCLVLDWKTNRIRPEQAESLRESYLPQLAAYRHALSAITKLEIDAALYSTATGMLLPYQEDELEREWTRLRAMPAPELMAEVSTP